MGFLRKVFDWVAGLVSEIVSIFKKILPYVALAFALYFMLASSPLTFTLLGADMSIGGVMGACLAIGTSFLLAPDETTALATKLVQGAADVAEAVIVAAAGVIGAGVGALANSSGLSTLLIIGGGLWLYMQMQKSKSHEADTDSYLASKPSTFLGDAT